MSEAIVVSCGAGVQSSWIVVGMAEKHSMFDKYQPQNGEELIFIFADTGVETIETYDFLNKELIPYIENLGHELIIVQRKDLYDMDENLMEYYKNHNGIPTRQFRSCTDKFKIAVIRRYLRRRGITRAKMLMGITLDEWKRARDSDVKWIENIFPIIDITRDEVLGLMNERGLYPVKSGCYFCPYLTSRRFLEYVDDKPIELNLVLDRW